MVGTAYQYDADAPRRLTKGMRMNTLRKWTKGDEYIEITQGVSTDSNSAVLDVVTNLPGGIPVHLKRQFQVSEQSKLIEMVERWAKEHGLSACVRESRLLAAWRPLVVVRVTALGSECWRTPAPALLYTLYNDVRSVQLIQDSPRIRLSARFSG